MAPALLVAGTGARAAADDDDGRPREESRRQGRRPRQAWAADACIDENVKADLFAKRKQRTSRERLFQQTNRHELTLQGGYYVSDTSTALHAPGESLRPYPSARVRLRVSHDRGPRRSRRRRRYTRLTSSRRARAGADLRGAGRTSRAGELMFDADLVWSPAHAKMRLGGSITHFDFYLAPAAAWSTRSCRATSPATAASGLKFFLGTGVRLRFDVRDHVFRQQLLAQTMCVNDLTTTVGLSIYLPMRE